jgi:hypothetical protein
MATVKTIEIGPANYKRLSDFAVGFGATPDSALTAVFAELDRLRAVGSGAVSDASTFEADAPPNLAFTNVRRVAFENEVLPHSSNYWNKVMEHVILAAAKAGWSAKEIIASSTAPMSIEASSQNGFRFLSEAGLSVQGQDSNGAWRQIQKLCAACGFRIEIEFQWQDTPKAALPNQRGKLAV